MKPIGGVALDPVTNFSTSDKQMDTLRIEDEVGSSISTTPGDSTIILQ
jgi:hypothetical protein